MILSAQDSLGRVTGEPLVCQDFGTELVYSDYYMADFLATEIASGKFLQQRANNIASW